MPTNIGGTIVPDSASNVSSNVGSRAISFGTNTTTSTSVVQQQLASSNAFGGLGICDLLSCWCWLCMVMLSGLWN